MKASVILICGFVAACNYDMGECYLRDDRGEGVGAGVITPGGAGGFGDAPPDPQDELERSECSEAVEAAAQVNCASPGSNTCVDQCEAIGAYCVHHASHPYSPSSGVGDLYWCKGGKPTWTCSYQYSNGDNCTIINPIGTWLCRYQFDK
ncbi:hypothetical protein [Sorangium sp. So ce426]|uniref:hypothetical protein n=1 Tax=Sorangium sp. So ce426 TaxID=3133312 RepID=UPI003F5B4B4A